MSPMPEPQPGRYLDRCGTPYEASRDKQARWWVKKLTTKEPVAYPKPDFPAAVNAGIFTYQS